MFFVFVVFHDVSEELHKRFFERACEVVSEAQKLVDSVVDSFILVVILDQYQKHV
tara:strand:- start:3293 stop:3457 length:165 start_codon:yes stop_codon:yes gene_type:complete